MSSQRQADHEPSGAEQERRLRAWARQHGWRLVAVHRDEGVSGTCEAMDRPGLSSALELLRSDHADALVLPTLDRLARSLTTQEAALGHVWRAGKRVFTLDAGEVHQDDPDDPMRTAMRQMVGVFAQLERGMVTARLRRGKAAKRAAGGYVGGAVDYGLRAVDGVVIDDPDEAALIARVCALRGDGASFRDICEALTSEGCSTRRGGPWQPAVVRRIAIRGGCA